MHCECANDIRLSTSLTIRKSFKRLPTVIEWARFRECAGRMRKLSGNPNFLSSETLPVLQLCTINEPLLPNLKTLDLWGVSGRFVHFIPLFLSLRVTSISLKFVSGLPKATVASTVSTLPTLCPNLQVIALLSLPIDPMITVAVSGMVLATNRNTIQALRVYSPLTEEAGELIFKSPGLRSLSVLIEWETSLPPASLPNLTELRIKCDDEGGWPRLFHGATFGKLESVTFYPKSEEIGDFLGAFERVALSSSVQNTLSTFCVSAACSWSPNYSSLLSLTHLVNLTIEFGCGDECSSTVDDDIVIILSQAMPKLQVLKLGDEPCQEFAIGATANGLVALALHCPELRDLCIHIQVASLGAPPVNPGIEPASSWTDCVLVNLVVGEIPVPESALVVALTLLRIFPRIERIDSIQDEWREVEDAIRLSKSIVGCSSKHSLTRPRSNLNDTSIEATFKTDG